jgi:hypothetical protein
MVLLPLVLDAGCCPGLLCYEVLAAVEAAAAAAVVGERLPQQQQASPAPGAGTLAPAATSTWIACNREADVSSTAPEARLRHLLRNMFCATLPISGMLALLNQEAASCSPHESPASPAHTTATAATCSHCCHDWQQLLLLILLLVIWDCCCSLTASVG